MKRQTFNRLIVATNFAELFITEMAWNNPTGPIKMPPVEIDSETYCPKVIADKCGFKVLVCEVDTIPTTSTCRRIDLKVRRFANDYILIFIQRSGFHHLWLIPVLKVDKRDIVITEYTTADQAEFLFQKVGNFAFAFDERVTITDVRQRVLESFVVNSEKITKDFFAGFRKEHKAFVEFISGIDGTDTAIKDRQWYASVMLNRLMFCYFIQKKGFLDGNTDYLQEKLRYVQRERGEGHFFRSFYIGFLRGLFHDGLNTPQHDEKFENIYGRLPYLNGGMFDEHKIEHDYADIDIADEAFERLFTFFDKWNWHLDTRITASGKDINPDVLGYIFEQYINDRAQMGAYYTKEDITEYIGRNCILPYLFDAVKSSAKEAANDFAPDGYVWRTLRESGDRYIFDAVKKGHDIFDQIPENIAQGIITSEMRHEYSETPVGDLPESHVPLAELRQDWNTKTPEAWGLPTEIWRESIERIQRCDDILGKINRGEITSINDFITYNLDIRSFASDLLSNGDSRFVGRFYHALQRVTILDPTCGSGAFLFAAMNILEPLYEICIDRMQEFNHQNPAMFKAELDEITDKYRSNIQYFIFKSIILRNLYGVDIMVEATEIAKLRLFLKMVAVVEVDRRADNLGLDPLPDIDFNIRCGNTLVGYATKEQLDRDLDHDEDILQAIANQEFKQQIDEEMQKVAAAYAIFKDVQLRQSEDMVAFKQAKKLLRERLVALNDKLNRRLYLGANGMNVPDGVDFTLTKEYRDWLTSHQPFHWLAEFYQIIEGNKGFDVIIGNPPYVEFPSKDVNYKFDTLKSSNCGNLYGCCIERGYQIGKSNGRFSFIIPVAITCSQRMNPVINMMKEESEYLQFANFDDRPGKLFEMIEHLRACIFISARSSQNTQPRIFASKYNRWYTSNRPILFTNLQFVDVTKFSASFIIPKFSQQIECDINSRLAELKSIICSFYGVSARNSVFYRAAGGGYFLLIKPTKSITYINGQLEDVKAEKGIAIRDGYSNINIAALLSSSLFYWNYIGYTDCRNLTKSFIDNFSCPNSLVTDIQLTKTGEELSNHYEKNRYKKDTYYKTTGRNVVYYEYYPKLSKSLIDKVDTILARHYGFTNEELDFIINYDIKYRMGDELNSSEE